MERKGINLLHNDNVLLLGWYMESFTATLSSWLFLFFGFCVRFDSHICTYLCGAHGILAGESGDGLILLKIYADKPIKVFFLPISIFVEIFSP
jgi:hypothetical protein